jgi:hypothetical protein
VLIVVLRRCTVDGAVTCAAPIPSPCVIVARRCAGLPERAAGCLGLRLA